MPLDPYDSIFQQFPPVTADEWKNRVIADLKGQSLEKLMWHGSDEIEVLPFYTKEDHKKYYLSIPAKKSEGWLITERIMVEDLAAANKNALEALQMGAHAILFDLQKKTYNKTEIELLIKNILVDVAKVYFEDYEEENKPVLESVVKGSCPGKMVIPSNASAVDELVYAIKEALHHDYEIPYFHFFTGTNYFLEIAKLRACRWLWKQACELNAKPYRLFLFSETEVQEHSDADEYSNMLRNTTEAMSTILGGCDTLVINSHDAVKENTGFGQRIARNIHHILQYESYFTEIHDAVKGSYYIEYLTYQLAKKSWDQLAES